MQLPRESLKNCFLSLALPSVVFSEPAAAQSTAINDTLSFTLWDKWEVRGHKTFKLQDFLKAIKVLQKYSNYVVIGRVVMIIAKCWYFNTKLITLTFCSLVPRPLPRFQ